MQIQFVARPAASGNLGGADPSALLPPATKKNRLRVGDPGLERPLALRARRDDTWLGHRCSEFPAHATFPNFALSSFQFEQRHESVLGALEVCREHCDSKLAFVQALRAQSKLLVILASACLVSGNNGVARRIAGPRQPCTLTGVPIQVQQGIGLTGHAAAEIADRTWNFGGVPRCSLGPFQILRIAEQHVGEGPEKYVSSAAIAPAGHVAAGLVGAACEVPLPAQSAS